MKQQRKVLKTYKDAEGYDVTELVMEEEEVEMDAPAQPTDTFGVHTQLKKRERDLETEWEERYLPKDERSPTKKAKVSSPPKKVVQKGIGAFFKKL